MSQAATEPVITPGRPIRLEPTAPGFWMTILGVAIAALAPLLGFLTGSSFGRPDGDVAVRLHELRSLSHVAGARGLAEAAAAVEQRVERGVRLEPGDVAALAAGARRAADAITHWWAVRLPPER